MSDTESPKNSRPKSSRRRRWEVKSRESFETSVAVELESPDKIQLRRNTRHNSGKSKKQRPKSSILKSSLKKHEENSYEEVQSVGEKTPDIANAKLACLLEGAQDEVKGDSNNQFLRDSEENLINSELKNYFLPNPTGSEPSAPPFSPPISPPQKEKTPQKRMSLQVKPIHSGVNVINSKITEHLHQMSSDVVDKDELKKELTTIPGVAVSGLLLGPSSSSTFNGNVSTIYCERLNNFVISSEEKVIKAQKNQVLRDLRKTETMKSFAIFLQTGFRTFSVLCQGILAGITFAHCLMVLTLEENIDILLEKTALEQTLISVTFFLLCICLVSTFDRCDMAGHGIVSGHGIRIPWNPLFYCVSLTLTLVMIKAEDFITHYNHHNPEIQSKKEHLITWWKFMCLARTCFAVLAWVGLVTDPHTDALNTRIGQLADE